MTRYRTWRCAVCGDFWVVGPRDAADLLPTLIAYHSSGHSRLGKYLQWDVFRPATDRPAAQAPEALPCGRP